jgi:hypothetical protein
VVLLAIVCWTAAAAADEDIHFHCCSVLSESVVDFPCCVGPAQFSFFPLFWFFLCPTRWPLSTPLFYLSIFSSNKFILIPNLFLQSISLCCSSSFLA